MKFVFRSVKKINWEDLPNFWEELKLHIVLLKCLLNLSPPVETKSNKTTKCNVGYYGLLIGFVNTVALTPTIVPCL